MSQSAEPPPVLSPAERQRAFSGAVADLGRFGTVVPLGEYQAQLATPGRKVNHVLHLLLSLVTCFLWVPVWIVVGVRAQPEQHRVIYVDELGRLWINGQLTTGEAV